MDELAEKLFHYIQPEEALEKIVKNVNLTPRVEVLKTFEACGRVLAEDIISPFPIPRHNVSHYDGYAVKSSDTSKASIANPVKLKIVGRIDSVSTHNLVIRDGEAAYIVTGAEMPENSDAVIPLERVRVSKDYIEILEPVNYGDNVTFRGSDIKEGELILRRGCILRPQDLRFLLDIGKFNVKVYAKPRVSLIGVGDELTENVDELAYKKFETSTFMISNHLKEHNAEPVRIGIIPDSPKEILETVKTSLDNSEITVTIGGVSLGSRDLCWTTLSKYSEAIPIARGLKIQPGRATSIIIIKGKPVIMLPGHIQSTLCGMVYALLPLIRYLQGLPMKNALPKVTAEMGADFVVKEYKSFKRIRFIKLIKVEDKFVAEPVLGDSSMLSTILKSNGFVEIPAGVERIEKGQEISVRLLSWSDIIQLYF